MVHMHGLKDKNLEFESERPLDASPPISSSSHLKNLLGGDLGLPLETSAKSDLVRIAHLTSKVMARMRATEAEITGSTEGTNEEAT